MRCSNRRMFTRPVVMTWPPSTEVTRVIGHEHPATSGHLDHQADDAGAAAGGTERDDDVAHPTDLVAERVEHAQAGQAADEDARRSAHAARLSGWSAVVGEAVAAPSSWSSAPVPGSPGRGRGLARRDRCGAGGRGVGPGASTGVPNGRRARTVHSRAHRSTASAEAFRRPAAQRVGGRAPGLVGGRDLVHGGLDGQQPATGVLAPQDQQHLLGQPRAGSARPARTRHTRSRRPRRARTARRGRRAAGPTSARTCSPPRRTAR